MEQKFNNNRLDLQILREFCEREGEEIAYRKGDQHGGSASSPKGASSM